MFNPEEEPEPRYALHVARRGYGIEIEKIPLLEVRDATDATKDNPEMNPIDEHQAYIVNGQLKISAEFPRKTEMDDYSYDMYTAFTIVKTNALVQSHKFQIIPIFYQRMSINNLFTNRAVIEFLIYHPSWDKSCIDLLKLYKKDLSEAIIRYIENEL